MLEGKNACFDHKNNKLKKSKYWQFFKGLVDGFGQNLELFPSFHLRQKKGEENELRDMLEGKNACLDYKNKKWKSRKIGIFPKGLIHGFGQKLQIFPCLYCRQNRSGKCVSECSLKKERLSKL